jgi:hypothetical protein
MKKIKLFQTIGFAALLAALLFASCEQEAFTPVNLTGEPAVLNAAVNIAPKPIQAPASWRVFNILPFGDVSPLPTQVRTITNGPYLVAAASDGTTAYASRFDPASGIWDKNSATLTGIGTANPSSSFFLNGYYLVTAGSNATVGDYSSNGVSWSPTGLIGFGTKAGLYGPLEQVYVVAGQNGQAAYTPNLSTQFKILSASVTGWTTGSGPQVYINAGAYGAGRYVFGGGSGRIAYTSSIQSGATWTTAIATPGATYPFPPTAFVDAIAYDGKDTFVASGDDGGKPSLGILAYSNNGGQTWQSAPISITAPILSAGIFALTYADGYFVAVNNNGDVAYSSNGINWTGATNAAFGTGSRVNAVVFQAPLNAFFAAGNSPNSRMEIAISP